LPVEGIGDSVRPARSELQTLMLRFIATNDSSR
jgi:hypothetical protein